MTAFLILQNLEADDKEKLLNGTENKAFTVNSKHLQ